MGFLKTPSRRQGWQMLIIAVLSHVMLGCQTTTPVHHGVRSEYRAFVPARIAVTPCRWWPNTAAYTGKGLSNASIEEQNQFCQVFDSEVIKGFTNQPFMKGASPKLVAKLLTKAGSPNYLLTLDDLWGVKSGDCVSCTDPAAFYTNSIGKRPEWQAWLNRFSWMVRNSDAVLIPFVTTMVSRKYEDNGLLVADRSADITLFLIDTNNGQLIWSGKRQASATSKLIPGKQIKAEPTLPPWKVVYDRLFTIHLWAEFPGRQVR